MSLGKTSWRPRIGVDIVAQGRVKRSLERYRDAFLARLLTEDELRHCQGPKMLERVSGRIAAKEAVMKVIGKGWPQVAWTDIQVLSDESGRPAASLSGKALQAMDDLKIAAIDVSITHDHGVAIAVAVGVLAESPRPEDIGT